MKLFSSLFLLATGAAVAVLIAILASCSDTKDFIANNNPYYIRAMKLREEKQFEEATASFQKCLRLTPETHEAHLQLAMLYDDHLGQPLKALYHYKMFIDNGRDAEKVALARQSFRELIRDFTSSLLEEFPSLKTDSADDDDKKDERVEELEQQKDKLLTKLRELNAELIKTRRHLQKRQQTVDQTIPDSSNGHPQTDRSEEQKEDFPEARFHTVERGDTLIKISRRYYDSGDYWEELLEVNEEKLQGDTSLEIGTELIIPDRAKIKEIRDS
ncbi:MAG: LysM peptidoglycan-binding domain-containing protein [Verrucomicrobiota bacterium]